MQCPNGEAFSPAKQLPVGMAVEVECYCWALLQGGRASSAAHDRRGTQCIGIIPEPCCCRNPAEPTVTWHPLVQGLRQSPAVPALWGEQVSGEYDTDIPWERWPNSFPAHVRDLLQLQNEPGHGPGGRSWGRSSVLAKSLGQRHHALPAPVLLLLWAAGDNETGHGVKVVGLGTAIHACITPLLQDVRCGWPALRTEEVDPLL